MKIVLQRVSAANVTVAGKIIGEINKGIMLLVGFSQDNMTPDLSKAVDKLLNLRIFENEEGKLDQSVTDIGGAFLVVPQFTLLAKTHKGRRPDFGGAMPPQQATVMFDQFVEKLKEHTDLTVQTGEFGADMKVSLCNEGPLTLILDY